MSTEQEREYRSGKHITNTEAIKQLERIKYGFDRSAPNGSIAKLEDGILRDRAIDKAITALKNPTAPVWNPCSEGLPVHCGEYRVTVLDTRCGARFGKNMNFNIHTRNWKDNEQKGLPQCYNVLAWQPLPEPYRGE